MWPQRTSLCNDWHRVLGESLAFVKWKMEYTLQNVFQLHQIKNASWGQKVKSQLPTPLRWRVAAEMSFAVRRYLRRRVDSVDFVRLFSFPCLVTFIHNDEPRNKHEDSHHHHFHTSAYDSSSFSSYSHLLFSVPSVSQLLPLSSYFPFPFCAFPFLVFLSLCLSAAPVHHTFL